MTVHEPTGDRLARLLEVDTSGDPSPPAPYWEHEPGATLDGTFIKWFTVTGSSEIPERIAIIEDDSGKRYAVGCRLTMLKDGFERVDPQPGERLTIRRGENIQTRKGHTLFQFDVIPDPNNGSSPRADENSGGGTR